MSKLLLLPSLLISVLVYSQSADEVRIRQILADQTAAWNHGDVKQFMQGYWKNDSLMFIGKSGITWGWNQALDNYMKRYPDTTAMGKLAFGIIVVKRLSPQYYYVVGKWMLTRSIGNLSGHYNLLFKKINGRWLIVADHSS
jgi:ketosteroid isomerase-like protein